MKRVLRLLTLAGAVAGAVWYSRQQSETVTESAGGEWKARPKLQAVPDRARPAPPDQQSDDDLRDIKGIGPKYAQQLKELGISSFAALAAADPEALSAAFDARAAVDDWIAQARTRSEA